jgi:hypothetical protein
LETSAEETKKRVEDIMKQTMNPFDIDKSTSEDSYKKVAIMAAKMFSGIRFFFTKYVRNKMNAFFLDPM